MWEQEQGSTRGRAPTAKSTDCTLCSSIDGEFALTIAIDDYKEEEEEEEGEIRRFDSIRGSLIGPPKYSDLLLSGVVARSSVSEATYKKSICSERVSVKGGMGVSRQTWLRV